MSAGSCGSTVTATTSSPVPTTTARYNPGTTYNAYLGLVEEEYRQDRVIDVLEDAWEEANTGTELNISKLKN